MSDYEKYVLAERRTGAEDMRERAAKLVFTVLNEGWSHKYSGFAGAVKERIESLPIDEGGSNG